MNEELSVEERNLLSVACNNVVGRHRAAWRIIAILGLPDADLVAEFSDGGNTSQAAESARLAREEASAVAEQGLAVAIQVCLGLVLNHSVSQCDGLLANTTRVRAHLRAERHRKGRYQRMIYTQFDERCSAAGFYR